MKWNIPQYTIIKNITKNQTSFPIKKTIFILLKLLQENQNKTML